MYEVFGLPCFIAFADTIAMPCARSYRCGVYRDPVKYMPSVCSETVLLKYISSLLDRSLHVLKR